MIPTTRFIAGGFFLGRNSGMIFFRKDGALASEAFWELQSPEVMKNGDSSSG
jgi:hypothetical protein